MGTLPKNPAEVLVWTKAFLEAMATSSATEQLVSKTALLKM